MLRKFRVKNFLSIRDWQTLDLTVAANAPDLPGRFVRSVPNSKDRFPTFVAIFGANASGKTNILRALTFLSNFVQESQNSQPTEPIPSIPFYGDRPNKEKTEFEVELDAPFDPSLAPEFDASFEPSVPRRKIHYRLAISPDRKQVLEEELSYYPMQRPRRLFRRRKQEFKFGDDFQIRKSDPAIGKIRKNSSVISTLAQFNHPLSEAILKGLISIQPSVGEVSGNREKILENMAQIYHDNPDTLHKFVEFSKRLDVGIERVEIISIEGSPRPIFYHRGLQMPIAHIMESQGTSRIFSLFPKLSYVLAAGGLAIVDELDNAIHSFLLPEIIDLFIDPESNPYHAQLIAACHNPSILQYLEKEEVFFAEKEIDGATAIYGLKDIEGVRRGSNFFSDYLVGAFGGVPIVA